MCYDVASQLRSQLKYARHIGASAEDIAYLERQLKKYEWTPYFRVDGFSKTRPKLPVVTNDKPNEIQFFEWKYLSDSVVNSKKGLNTLNATRERIFISNTYKDAAQKRHCLVLVDGFFEPHGFGKIKKKVRYGKTISDYEKKAYYFIESKDDMPLSLAGLWNEWADPETGEIRQTCTIITVPASPLLSKIHNVMERMPAIIPKELQKEWLEAVSPDPEPLLKQKSEELLQPYDDDLLTYRTVYNIKKRDGFGNSPQTIEEYDYTIDPEFEPI